MSSHTYQLPYPPTSDQLARLIGAAGAAGRPIAMCSVDGTNVTIIFDVDLSPAEVSVLDEIMRAAKTDLTRAERNGIQADSDGLVTYQGLASPTLAQTVAAVKAQSRILRAMLRS